ncbi:MAG: SH3 domain-containing protein [Saprospiraceae bacterium]|nr:SH3 domain-containing protein [Saprospiraceae bacterium]
MHKYLFLIIFFFSVKLWAADIKELMTEANGLYEAGVYDEALTQYLQVEKEGYTSAALYGNIAACYAKLGQNGKAVLYYERGLKFDPNNKMLKNDLNIVRNRISGLDDEVPEFVPVRVWKYLSHLLSERSWLVLNVLFGYLILAMLYTLWFPHKWLSKSKAKALLIGFGILFVLSFLLGYSAKTDITDQNKAIVTNTDTSLKSGPDILSPDILVLPEGAKVIIQDKIGDWLKVVTYSGDNGWVINSALERI